MGNRFLTFMSNAFTNLNLSDMETCYKAAKASIFRSIPIRSRRFGLEPEMTAKFAKRRCRIYEVPISYRGRTYLEGKKITWRDGFKALFTIVWFRLVHDLYNEEYGATSFSASTAAPPTACGWPAGSTNGWATGCWRSAPGWEPIRCFSSRANATSPPTQTPSTSRILRTASRVSGEPAW